MKSFPIFKIQSFCISMLLFFSCTGRQEHSALAKESDLIFKTIDVVKSMSAGSDQTIPQSILKSAGGIAIVPGLLKAALGIGGQYGKGVMSVRMPSGAWSSPSFITVGGGSIGLQLGGESVDLVLVFKTPSGVFMAERGKVTFGVNASVAAGPIGRRASASTTAQFNAEVLSYARSKGLFAGASVDGLHLGIDDDANAAFYRSDTISTKRIFGGDVPVLPNDAVAFVNALMAAGRQSGSPEQSEKQIGEAVDRVLKSGDEGREQTGK
jgi:lipid-binding SYLF domain-containing protein